MPYGTIKVDNITFTNAGSDQTITVSGLFSSTSGNLTVTGTVSGNTIQGQTISGVTVTGTTANFTSGNFTNISGGTHTITSGVFAAGSAAAPSISFVSDPNTGIYSPGADQVAISTNGTGRLFVDASGRITNVGTGLQVNYGGYSDVTFADPGSGNNIYLLTYTPGGAFFLGSNNGATFNYGWGSSSTGHIWHTGSGNERMRLDSSGRLGLGTSSPATNLDIRGTNSAQLRIGSTSGDLGNNTEIGTLEFFNSDANQNAIAAYVRATRGGGFGSGGYLTFGVSASGSSASAATEALRIDESGRVGIGTTGPGSFTPGNLVVEAATTAGITISDSTGGGTASIAFSATSSFQNKAKINCTISSQSLEFSTAGSERARIDSSGRLLVGTSTARSNVQFGGGNTTPTVQVETAGDSRFGLSVINNSANGYAGAIRIGAARGTSVGSNTALVDTAGLGSLSFVGADGTNLIEGARIDAVVNGTPGTNDLPTALVFSTTADGASSPTERMRIGASGNVGIGQSDEATIRLAVTSTGTAYAGYFSYPGSTAQGVGFNSTGAGSSYAAYFFNNGTNVGSIYTTSSSTSYNTSSDYRLKENVVPLTGAIDRINELQVHRFNFIADPGKTVDGFIAHEAQAVVPECVTGTKDQVDADGNPVYQGIDQSKLVPLLTAALQEALTEIESLKARVTALEP